MQHNVTDTVLNAFSGARAGLRWRSPLGFSVVALHAEPVDQLLPTASALSRRSLRSEPYPTTLLWREESPPHPGRLRALNPGAGAVVVDAGVVVDGGMSMRAVQATTFIPARAEITVAVEVLGARWWDEGQLLRSGMLDPVITALILQAALGVGAVASSARTAAWSLSPSEIASAPGVVPIPGSSGWIIVDDQGVVAGRMQNMSSDTSRGAWSELDGADLVDVGESLDLFASLRDGIDRGALEAHVVGHDRRARDLIVLPSDFRLVDRVVAATSGQLEDTAVSR